MSISELFPSIYQHFIEAKSSAQDNVDRLLFQANTESELCWETKSYFPFRCFQSARFRATAIEISLCNVTKAITKMVDNRATTPNDLLLQHEHMQEFIDTLVHIATHVEEKFRMNSKRTVRLSRLTEEKERLCTLKRQISERVASQARAVLRPIPPLPVLGKTTSANLEGESIETLIERVLRKESQAAKVILNSPGLLETMFQAATEDAIQELFTLLLTEKWHDTLEALVIPFKDGKLPLQILADRKFKDVISRIITEVIRKNELPFLKRVIVTPTKSQDLMVHVFAKNGLQSVVNQSFAALALSSTELKAVVTAKGCAQMTLLHYMVMYREGIIPFVQLLTSTFGTDFYSMLRAIDLDNHSPMFYAAKYKNITFLNLVYEHFRTQREELLKLFNGVMVVLSQKGDLDLFSYMQTKFDLKEIARLLDVEYQFSRLLVCSIRRKKYPFLKAVISFFKNDRAVRRELLWHVVQELYESGDEMLFDCLKTSMTSQELCELLTEHDSANQPLIFTLVRHGYYTLLEKIMSHFSGKDIGLAFGVIAVANTSGGTLISLLCNHENAQAQQCGAAIFKMLFSDNVSLCLRLIEEKPELIERCITSLVMDSRGYALVDAFLKANPQVCTKLKEREDAGMSVGFIAYITAKEKVRSRPLKQMVLDTSMTQYKDQTIAHMIKRYTCLLREADFEEVLDADNQSTLAHVIVEKGLVQTYNLCMRRESFSNCCSRNKNRAGKTPEQLADTKREFREYQQQHGDNEPIIIYRRG